MCVCCLFYSCMILCVCLSHRWFLSLLTCSLSSFLAAQPGPQAVQRHVHGHNLQCGAQCAAQRHAQLAEGEGECCSGIYFEGEGVCLYCSSAPFVCRVMCLYVLCIEKDVNMLERSMDPIVFVCLIAIINCVYSRSADKH